MLIKNGNVVLLDHYEAVDIRIKDSFIKEIGKNLKEEKGEEVYDASFLTLLPGFVDTHTHGSGGFDFMDGSTLDILNALKSHAKYGTTTVLPTSLSSSDEDLFLFIDNVKEVKKTKYEGARVGGIHLEGPYFSLNEKGAQDPRYIRKPDKKHYSKIIEKGEGLIKRWTYAPELEGAKDFVSFITQNGILASAGHTEATYDEISEQYDMGLRELTHFYSGMSGIRRVGGFRVLGAIESGYLLDDLYVELICDGMHLPPDLLRYIFRFKRHDRIIACSDSMRGAGMSDGPSILGSKKDGTEVIIEDGIAKMLDRTCFAGSVATGIRMLKTLVSIMEIEIVEASKYLSLYPAKTISMDKEIGSIEENKKADIVFIDKDLNIIDVLINGKLLNRSKV